MNEEKLLEFGLYLKSLREGKDLTLNELAQKTGYSDAYISQVEKGRRKNPPTIDMLKHLSDALNTPYSELLRKAGYAELAEGQYFKEMFSSLGLSSGFPEDLTRYDDNEDLKRVTKLMNVWFRGVLKWTEDMRFTDNDTIMLREHFAELLIRYKQLIESLANTHNHWSDSKDHFMKAWGESTTETGVRQFFLKAELDKDIQSITEWIDGFPAWVANNEDDQKSGGEKNGHNPKKK